MLKLKIQCLEFQGSFYNFLQSTLLQIFKDNIIIYTHSFLLKIDANSYFQSPTLKTWFSVLLSISPHSLDLFHFIWLLLKYTEVDILIKAMTDQCRIKWSCLSWFEISIVSLDCVTFFANDVVMLIHKWVIG